MNISKVRSWYKDHLRLPVRVAGVLLVTLLAIPVHLLVLLCPGTKVWTVPMLWHKAMCRICGFRIQTYGRRMKAPSGAAIFYVSNHSSYTDILVLGASVPAMFVAKKEVSGWPGIGQLARLQGTLFVERRSGAVKKQYEQLSGHIARGNNLILFPEGTTGNGREVLPFKSSLFGIVKQEATPPATKIQPVSIVYTHINDKPIVGDERDLVAWYILDQALIPHVVPFLKLGRVTVEVRFHEPLSPADFQDRKELALACQKRVVEGVRESLRFDTSIV